MKARFVIALGVASLGLYAAAPSWANVPAPPVNQFLGIPDTMSTNLTETQCRACHDNPSITGPTSNVNKHHMLTQPPPKGESRGCLKTSAFPNAPSGCHTVSATGVFDPFRNCLLCHTQIPGSASVHHADPNGTAAKGQCTPCHGALVQPMDDGHYVPTYAPSLVTPKPVTGNGAPNWNNTASQGGCEYCHGVGTDTGTNFLGQNTVVASNQSTHHLDTGFGVTDSGKCVWCHNTAVTSSQWNIRQCEACHGVQSLHSIQISSKSPIAPLPPGQLNPSAVVVGGELAGYGHIGNNDDCMGCHGFTAASAGAAATSTVPWANFLSFGSITANRATTLTIEGSNFVNYDASGNAYTGSVLVENDSGFSQTLTPTSIDPLTVTVTVPGLQPGKYYVSVVKDGLKSNKKPLVVITPATIVSAKVSDRNVVTIVGKGFGAEAYFAANGTGFGVTVAGKPCTILSWSDGVVLALPQVAVKSGDAAVLTGLWGQSAFPLTAPTKSRTTLKAR